MNQQVRHQIQGLAWAAHHVRQYRRIRPGWHWVQTCRNTWNLELFADVVNEWQGVAMIDDRFTSLAGGENIFHDVFQHGADDTVGA